MSVWSMSINNFNLKGCLQVSWCLLLDASYGLILKCLMYIHGCCCFKRYIMMYPYEFVPVSLYRVSDQYSDTINNRTLLHEGIIGYTMEKKSDFTESGNWKIELALEVISEALFGKVLYHWGPTRPCCCIPDICHCSCLGCQRVSCWNVDWVAPSMTGSFFLQWTPPATH